ncbi:MAG: TonB-dependent receptor [Thermoanaerobaculia bacterium]|nr:TonB-dependent receptor [Thermoanaerobaculia bacterium]
MLLALLLVAGLATAAAEEPTELDPEELDRMSLEEVLGLQVASATKTGVALERAPSWVTLIDRRQIEASAARTLPELLRRVAGVNVRWNPMVTTMTIRGFGQLPFSSRVLLLIDGVPQNSANKGGFRPHPLPDFFSLQHVQRIEVIRGPGAALYGENAFWGVINVVTRSAGEMDSRGSVELFGGDRETRSAGAVFGKEWAEGALLVSGRAGQSGFAPEFWRESGSGVEAGDLLVKARREPVTFSYYRYQDEIDGFDFGPLRSVSDLEQEVDVATLRYRQELDGGRIELAGDLAYARRDGMYCGSCHAAGQRPEFARSADHGSELLGEVRAGIRPVPSHHLLVGVEARRVEAGDKPVELLPPEEAGVRDYDYEKLAVWAQDRITALDGELEMTLGFRYDGEADDLYGDELSPRVAAVWLPRDGVTVRGSWATAFRFPSLSERYQNSWWLSLQQPGGAIPLAIFDPDPTLEPERIETFELGGEMEISPELQLRGALFQSTVEDFVVLAFREGPGPLRVTFANHPDEARQRGAETEIRYRPGDRIDARLGWAWQEVDQEGDLRDLAGRRLQPLYAPDHRLVFNAYLGPAGPWSGSVEATWVGDYPVPGFWADFTGMDTEGGDHLLLDLRLDWTRPVPRLGGQIQLSLYATDLLDEAPRETLVGFDTSLPGRELFGGITWSF